MLDEVGRASQVVDSEVEAVEIVSRLEGREANSRADALLQPTGPPPAECAVAVEDKEGTLVVGGRLPRYRLCPISHTVSVRTGENAPRARGADMCSSFRKAYLHSVCVFSGRVTQSRGRERGKNA